MTFASVRIRSWTLLRKQSRNVTRIFCTAQKPIEHVEMMFISKTGIKPNVYAGAIWFGTGVQVETFWIRFHSHTLICSWFARIQIFVPTGHRVVASLQWSTSHLCFRLTIFNPITFLSFSLFHFSSELFLTLVNLRVGAPPNERPFGLPIWRLAVPRNFGLDFCPTFRRFPPAPLACFLAPAPLPPPRRNPILFFLMMSSKLISILSTILLEFCFFVISLNFTIIHSSSSSFRFRFVRRVSLTRRLTVRRLQQEWIMWIDYFNMSAWKLWSKQRH